MTLRDLICGYSVSLTVVAHFKLACRTPKGSNAIDARIADLDDQSRRAREEREKLLRRMHGTVQSDEVRSAPQPAKINVFPVGSLLFQEHRSADGAFFTEEILLADEVRLALPCPSGFDYNWFLLVILSPTEPPNY